MSNFKRIELRFNDNGKLIDSSGRELHQDEMPHFIYGEIVVICATFYHVTNNNGVYELTPRSLADGGSYACFAGSDFSGENLLFLGDSAGNQVNCTGDWPGNTTASLSSGQLSFRVNTYTANFLAALNNHPSAAAYLVITVIPPGNSDCSVLAMCSVPILNRPASQSGPVADVTVEYYTANQVLSLLAAGFAVQFAPTQTSADIAETRRLNDRYYRFRHTANANSLWSPWIELFDGKSAYDLWLAAGNTGSEADFLNSLKAVSGSSAADVNITIAELPANKKFQITAAAANLSGPTAVQLFDNSGRLYWGNCITMSWQTQTLTVDFTDAANCSGVWTLRFAGGSAPTA